LVRWALKVDSDRERFVADVGEDVREDADLPPREHGRGDRPAPSGP
jgi:hypothetical protein